MYTIQWKTFDNKWEDFTSHYFFYRARKKLFKHCMKNKYLASTWRIVDNDGNIKFALWLGYSFDPSMKSKLNSLN